LMWQFKKKTQADTWQKLNLTCGSCCFKKKQS